MEHEIQGCFFPLTATKTLVYLVSLEQLGERGTTHESIVASVHMFCRLVRMDLPAHPEYDRLLRGAAEEEIRTAAALSSHMAKMASGT